MERGICDFILPKIFQFLDDFFKIKINFQITNFQGVPKLIRVSVFSIEIHLQSNFLKIMSHFCSWLFKYFQKISKV